MCGTTIWLANVERFGNDGAKLVDFLLVGGASSKNGIILIAFICLYCCKLWQVLSRSLLAPAVRRGEGSMRKN